MKKMFLLFLLLASTAALAQPHDQKPLPQTPQQTIEQRFDLLIAQGLKEDPEWSKHSSAESRRHAFIVFE
jgi:hypothetical protein